MVRLLVMGCALVLSVPLILAGGAIAPAPPPPPSLLNPPAIIRLVERMNMNIIDSKEGSDNMKNNTIRDDLREGVVIRSIKILRAGGMSEEKIKEKIMESFSLDEETINRLLD